MSHTVIKIEHVFKQYNLNQVGTGTMIHDLNRWWHLVRGKEDPYLRLGEENKRSEKGKSNLVWALQDIDLSIEEGDVFGIIGKNGAGKSTLLKILSRVTTPTKGSIKVKGRLASLLEVGTGFHPELTGRENIYLNGAILGMTKKEIARKFDEIVDFSGVAKYIDTPVKRYSSGMTVRLGFAVAAHLEPEILVVDEVLAVGDFEFQKKAIGKMQDVSSKEGRTILFVSHNLPSVRNLCNKGIVLKNGSVTFSGSSSEAVDNYLQENAFLVKAGKVNFDNSFRKYPLFKEVEFLCLTLVNVSDNNFISNKSPIELIFEMKGNKNVGEVRIAGGVFSYDETPIGVFFTKESLVFQEGIVSRVSIKIYNHQLAKGQYYMDFSVGIGNEITGFKDFDHVSKAVFFEVAFDDIDRKHMISIWHSSWGKINFNNIELNQMS